LKTKVKLIIWAILLILATILIWNNAGVTDLRFFFKTFHVSQIVIILVSLIIGFIAGLLVEGRKKILPKKLEKSEEES
jgi:uncharacterized integral membrane protein